jgi:hypothetical protein
MKARHLLSAVGALIALGSSAAHANSVDQYLKLRRQIAFDPRLTYKIVQGNPADYVGRILELRGAVDGYVVKDKTISFLFSLADKQGVMLNINADDAALVMSTSHQTLRVLAKVVDGALGNVVGLEVVATVWDAEITNKEKEAQAREEAIARRQAAATRSTTITTSRHSSGRQDYSIGTVPGLSELALRALTPEAQSVLPIYKGYILKCNPRLTAEQLDVIAIAVLHYGIRYRIDPRLVIALIIAESDFDPRSTSNKGAMGLAQLMPDEARNNRLSDPYDPVQNIATAVGLLRDKLDRYRTQNLPSGVYSVDQIKLALAAYNAGPGAVKKYGGVPPYRETQGYIRKILRIYSELTAGDG